MDFYIDLGVAAILRVLKDRRIASRYYDALAKVFVRLEMLHDQDGTFASAVIRQRDKASA